MTSSIKARVSRLEGARAGGGATAGEIGELIRAAVRGDLAAVVSEWEREHGRRLPASVVERVEKIAARLAAFDAEIDQRTAGEPVPFFSEAHNMMMVDVGGFHLPAAISTPAWQLSAIAQQESLIAHGIPTDGREVEARRELPPRPIPGAPVPVVRRATGVVEARSRVDAAEMLQGNEYEVFVGSTPALPS